MRVEEAMKAWNMQCFIFHSHPLTFLCIAWCFLVFPRIVFLFNRVSLGPWLWSWAIKLHNSSSCFQACIHTESFLFSPCRRYTDCVVFWFSFWTKIRRSFSSCWETLDELVLFFSVTDRVTLCLFFILLAEVFCYWGGLEIESTWWGTKHHVELYCPVWTQDTSSMSTGYREVDQASWKAVGNGRWWKRFVRWVCGWVVCVCCFPCLSLK